MKIWQPVLAGTAALVIVGSTLVYAQQRPDARRWQPNLDDIRAFGDARLAALKAGLALKPDQEKNWPAFEQAARDLQKLRVDRLSTGIEARRSGTPRTSDPAERLQQRATAMTETGSALKKLADATGPLYSSLDDSQKRRFGVLSRLTLGDSSARQHRMMHNGFHGFHGFRRTDAPGMGVEGGSSQGAPARQFMRPSRGEEEL